ncbi:MAG: histidinol-phosphate phosphatase [Prosthecobacter sp.]|nr:histidinol-phosphate phosphatase [Prosthecobacter sp.]
MVDFLKADKPLPHTAVFIDKDGTLVDDVPYNVDPAQVKLAAGVTKGLARLAATNHRLFIVSNQPGIARGYFDKASLEALEQHLQGLFIEHGCRLDGFYYCPHDRPLSNVPLCECRKPQPGLLLRAARDHDICLNHSWFIGDILDDVEAGHRAGCKAILIDNGNETEWQSGPLRVPDHTVADFDQAVARILDRKPGMLETCFV